MPIPKKIYQTWCTEQLPENICNNIRHFLDMNPDYDYQLFTDEDMENYVRNNFDDEIYHCYMRLNIIVAKTDFWRYLLLYKDGGIYLDMDGDILKPLNEMIRADDTAIITAETNPYMFVQWALFFEPGHPILKRAIEIVVYNIKNNLHPRDVHQLTGPSVFTLAVHMMHDQYIPNVSLVHSEITAETDRIYENKEAGFKYRIFGVDYNGFCSFENPYKKELFVNKTHWREQQCQMRTVNTNT